MGIIAWLLIRLLNLFNLLLLLYVVVSVARVPENRWTVLLKSIVEPVLNPIRGFLSKHLPQNLQVLDWSPVGAWVLTSVLKGILAILR